MHETLDVGREEQCETLCNEIHWKVPASYVGVLPTRPNSSLVPSLQAARSVSRCSPWVVGRNTTGNDTNFPGLENEKYQFTKTNSTLKSNQCQHCAYLARITFCAISGSAKCPNIWRLVRGLAYVEEGGGVCTQWLRRTQWCEQH